MYICILGRWPKIAKLLLFIIIIIIIIIIITDQPVQYVQADPNRYILLMLNFLRDKRNDFNPLPDMPILGFSNSAANKDMMSKIWTNGDIFI